MKGKIIENATDLLRKVDKELVEKFQSVIGEIRGRVDGLKNDILEDVRIQ
jgi:hypothetical protein